MLSPVKTNLYETDSYLANARDRIATRHNRKLMLWFLLNLITMITFSVFTVRHITDDNIPGWLGFIIFVVGIYQTILTLELVVRMQIKRKQKSATAIRNKPGRTEVKLKHWLRPI